MIITTEQPTSPTLFLIGGFAGSGKTHFGDILIRHLVQQKKPACLLDKDTIERPLLEVGLSVLSGNPNDRESELYLNTFRGPEYAGVFAGATNNLILGVNTVITAPFLMEFGDQKWIANVEQEMGMLDVTVVWIWLRCSEDLAIQRLKARAAARDVWKLNHWSDYLSFLPWGYNDYPKWATKGIIVENDDKIIDPFDHQLPEELMLLLS